MSGGDTNEDADHRYMMFSATFNKACRLLARKFLAVDHVRVRIGRPGSAHINVHQNVGLFSNLREDRANERIDHLRRRWNEKEVPVRPSSVHATLAYFDLRQHQDAG